MKPIVKKEILTAYVNLLEECKQNLDLDNMLFYDPMIERMIEAMAYLSGKLSLQIDDQLSELTEFILLRLDKEQLKPKPCEMVVQFEDVLLRPYAHEIAQASKLYFTRENEKIIFSLCERTIIQPIQLKQVMTKDKDEQIHLALYFSFLPGVSEKKIESIRVFLDADEEIRLSLLHAFFAPDTECRISSDSFDIKLNKDRFSQPFFSNQDEGLNHQLKGYFNDDPGLYFIDIDVGEILFNKVESWCISIKTNVCINLNGRNVFQLHCAKVSNVYLSQLEPLRIDGSQIKYPLNYDVDKENEVVVEIKEVLSDLKKNEWLPFYDFGSDESGGSFYRFLREEQEDYFILLSGKQACEKQVLSIKAHVSHGKLEVSQSSYQVLEWLEHSYRNDLKIITKTPITPFEPAPGKEETYCRLVSKLSESELLGLNVNIVKFELKKTMGKNKYGSRIKSIKEVNVESTSRIREAAWEEIVTINVIMTQCSFSREAELFLFTKVLHHYFSKLADVGCFVETIVGFSERKEKLKWMSSLVGQYLCV